MVVTGQCPQTTTFLKRKESRCGIGPRSFRLQVWSVLVKPRLQALVYDILPSTTAVFSYAIGSRKLSANEFFVGAQTVVSLLQTTQIKQGVSFIAAKKVYTSTNKPQSFESRRNSFFSFFYPGWKRLTCLRASLGARLLLQSY